MQVCAVSKRCRYVAVQLVSMKTQPPKLIQVAHLHCNKNQNQNQTRSSEMHQSSLMLLGLRGYNLCDWIFFIQELQKKPADALGGPTCKGSL